MTQFVTSLAELDAKAIKVASAQAAYEAAKARIEEAKAAAEDAKQGVASAKSEYDDMLASAEESTGVSKSKLKRMAEDRLQALRDAGVLETTAADSKPKTTRKSRKAKKSSEGSAAEGEGSAKKHPALNPLETTQKDAHGKNSHEENLDAATFSDLGPSKLTLPADDGDGGPDAEDLSVEAESVAAPEEVVAVGTLDAEKTDAQVDATTQTEEAPEGAVDGSSESAEVGGEHSAETEAESGAQDDDATPNEAAPAQPRRGEMPAFLRESSGDVGKPAEGAAARFSRPSFLPQKK